MREDKILCQGLSTYMGDNPFAKANRLSPHTGGQTMV